MTVATTVPIWSLFPIGSCPGQYRFAAVWSTISYQRRLSVVILSEIAPLENRHAQRLEVSRRHIGPAHLQRFMRAGHISFRVCVHPSFG